MRKIIYTTNAIESLNRVIRKTTKTRGSFPTDAAATKLIYLAIRNFEKAGRCVREWVAARNQFAILYGRVASITGQARSTLTRENGQPTDSNLAQPSSVILLRARTPICASVF